MISFFKKNNIEFIASISVIFFVFFLIDFFFKFIIQH
jgi:hypothetical protein